MIVDEGTHQVNYFWSGMVFLVPAWKMGREPKKERRGRGRKEPLQANNPWILKNPVCQQIGRTCDWLG